jgi:hypothetical protein
MKILPSSRRQVTFYATLLIVLSVFLLLAFDALGVNLSGEVRSLICGVLGGLAGMVAAGWYATRTVDQAAKERFLADDVIG